VKLAGIALALALAGCGGERENAEPAANETQYEVRPVVATAIVELEGALGPEPAAVPEPDAELRARVDGLLETVAGSRDQLRRAALEELAGLGDAAVPLLEAKLEDAEAAAALRRAAAEVLGAIDATAAARALLERLELARTEVDPDPWMRATCAWQLGLTSQDWAVPRLVLCLKYEVDQETVLWLAESLARFGNFAGLEGAAVVEAQGATPEVRARAAELRARLAQEHGFASPADLERAWHEGDPEGKLPPDAPSARHRLELWRTIASLAEWQLRGVDDARFVLPRGRASGARLLAQALRDENRYVRVHSAQCLERMGPRARPAIPALIEALDDPVCGPTAAAALGSLGAREAIPALTECLAGAVDPDLRAAASRALEALGR
jgi:HEAT repeat protein